VSLPGRVVILTPFLWDFFFHCIVLQISMQFEMAFLIKNKMKKKQNKNQACKFWPPLLHMGKRKKDKTCYLTEFTFNHFSFSAGGKRSCFKFEVYNLLCYNNKT